MKWTLVLFLLLVWLQGSMEIEEIVGVADNKVYVSHFMFELVH